MKVFISQPMGGKTDEQIRQERAALVMRLEECGDTVVDSVFPDTPKDGNIPLRYLAKSIDLIAGVDKVIFMPGWEAARGCKIEHDCCAAYGVEIEYM